jgi:hypothetical protein
VNHLDDSGSSPDPCQKCRRSRRRNRARRHRDRRAKAHRDSKGPTLLETLMSFRPRPRGPQIQSPPHKPRNPPPAMSYSHHGARPASIVPPKHPAAEQRSRQQSPDP